MQAASVFRVYWSVNCAATESTIRQGLKIITMRESYRVVAPDRFLTTDFIDEVVTIRHGEHVVVNTDHAVRLLEGDRPGVTYVPVGEFHGATLQASRTEYHCRWKGNARYYDIQLSSGELIADGAWAYPDAPDEIVLLQTRIAFDTARFNEQFTPK